MAKTITAKVVMRKPSDRDPERVGVKDTDDKWWNFPKDKINFGVGAVIVIEAVTGAARKDVTKFTVKSGAASGGASSGGGGVGGQPVDWGGAVARAIEATDLLLRNDAVALGPKGAKPADKQAVILDLIDELTARFFTDTTERRPLKKARELADDLGEGGVDDGDGGLGDDEEDF